MERRVEKNRRMDKIASRHRRTQKRTEGTYKARLLNSRRKKHRKRGERKN